MVLLARKKLIAAKIESTPGTAESLADADVAFRAYDYEDISPTVPTEPRQAQGSMSHNVAARGPRSGVVTFKTPLHGDGAAGTPTWASTLLPACGFVESLGTFSPTSEPPGSNVKTLTMAVYKDGLKTILRGCAGNFKLMMESGQEIAIEWTFTGVWSKPADVAILTPTEPSTGALRFASTTFTIGGAAPGCVQNLEIDAGGVVTLLNCPTTAEGYDYAIVADRRPVGTLDPETRLVATEDLHGKWLDGTEEALSVALTDGTDTITIAAPKLQRTNVQPGSRENVSIDQVEFQLNKSGQAGDDELTIDFS